MDIIAILEDILKMYKKEDIRFIELGKILLDDLGIKLTSKAGIDVNDFALLSFHGVDIVSGKTNDFLIKVVTDDQKRTSDKD